MVRDQCHASMRKRMLFSCALMASACGPARYAGPAAIDPPEGQSSPDGIPIVQPAAPEPEPDTRTPGQVVVDILVSQGFACDAEESAWRCVPPSAKDWQLYVSFLNEANGTVTIWYDSYYARAFGQRCNRYNNAMRDLANTQFQFSVSCSDETQLFRMNTAVTYGPDLDVTGWANDHVQRRFDSWKLLDSIGAVRK